MLTSGTRLGVYEIVSPLGQGGMGQVYRARDTRLDRDVALKVLPEAFVTDPDRVMRFTREAKTLASLNHPHIAQIHDAGRVRPDDAPKSQSRELAYIAMELVHGDDLSARISQGPVPLNEALNIARQIADALSAAHDAGIVHRDLKPANIKITDDGVVKVLDFGLAKGGAAESSLAGDSGATMTSPAMTAMGLILGTAAYMAPEQAKGKPVDRRADVWAFGVVLYEMLTGAFLFGREDVTDTLAAVLTHEPDLTKLPASTPPTVRRLLAHCLAKDKRQRLDSLAVARIDIEELLSGKTTDVPTPAAPPAFNTWTRGLVFAAGGLVVGVLAATLWPRSAPAASPGPPLVARLTAPPEVISAFHEGFALSRDGTMLAFTARNAEGVRQIWTRRLDADAAQPIQGTDGALYPFWSPDGRSIGFYAGGKLRRVDLDGGRLQTICDAPGGGQVASWNERDEVLWEGAVGNEARVFKVAAGGGSAAAIEAIGNAFSPVWLIGGERFLYAGPDAAGKMEVRVASADGKSSTAIAPLTRGSAEFAYGGGVLFMQRNDTLVAQRLDSSTGALVGEAVAIAPEAGNPKDWFSVASNGDRVVALVRESRTDTGDPGDPSARLIWVDRHGTTTGSLGESGRYWTLRLAPDGLNAVVNPGNDLWLLRPDGRHMRLTSGEQKFSPVWNGDGSELVYIQGQTVFSRRTDPQSQATKLENVIGLPQDWSSDGRYLLFSGRGSQTSTTADIVMYDFEKKEVRPWLATQFSEGHPRFSRDGQWVAYDSNASERREVYIRPFAGDGQAIQVSTAGGSMPIWRRDGGELYFLSPVDDVMAVTLTRSGGSITPAQPKRLFRIPLNDITRGTWAPYDVSADGERFLLNVPDRPTPLFFLQGLAGMLR